jgi:hypothetical protein
VIYYSPGNSLLKGVNNNTTQHIDIVPSIMDYLNYEEPFFAFGNSVFDPSNDSYAVTYLDAKYQLMKNQFSFTLDSVAGNLLYNFTVDSLLKNNLAASDTFTDKMMEKKLKSVIQNFRHVMIHNEMK